MPAALVPAVVLVLAAGKTQRAHESDAAFVRSLQQGPGDINHPVGVVPSSRVRIPGGWPVDSRGTITCSTCHDGVPSLAGGDDARLRHASGGAGFCGQCHEGGTSGGSSGHWQAMERAHVFVDRSGSGRASRGSPDVESRRCLSCHDGVNAPDAAGVAGHGTGGYAGDPRSSHPVGVAYKQGWTAAGGARMRPLGLLPREVWLPGGEVSCVSCHNLYDLGPARLAVPIEGSRLCLTCHDMD